jgi:hypothetical protein
VKRRMLAIVGLGLALFGEAFIIAMPLSVLLAGCHKKKPAPPLMTPALPAPVKVTMHATLPRAQYDCGTIDTVQVVTDEDDRIWPEPETCNEAKAALAGALYGGAPSPLKGEWTVSFVADGPPSFAGDKKLIEVPMGDLGTLRNAILQAAHFEKYGS